MKLNFKICKATIRRYEDNGEAIKRVDEDIVIKGQRITLPAVRRQIPEGATLLSWGYVNESYEIDTAELLKFCKEHGAPITD